MTTNIRRPIDPPMVLLVPRYNIEPIEVELDTIRLDVSTLKLTFQLVAPRILIATIQMGKPKLHMYAIQSCTTYATRLTSSSFTTTCVHDE